MSANQRGRSSGGSTDASPAPKEPAKVRDLFGAGAADTLPPTPLKDLLSAGGANVYVLSADAELIDTAQRAGGDHYPVFTVGAWAELEAAVVSGHCGIALLDAAFLDAELAPAIAKLQRHADRVVVLVAADRTAAQELITPLSDRRIHRLLIKPPALGITRLLLESAVTRCLQLREGGLAPKPTTVAALPRRIHPVWIGLAAGLAVVVAAAAWYGATRPSPNEPAAAAPPPAAVAQPAEERAAAPGPSSSARSAELLSLAQRALGEGRLTEPPGDNALDYYLVVLASDPNNDVASERLDALVDMLFAQAEAALLDDAFDAAATALAAVRRADASSGRLAFLEAQLERARTAAATAAAKAEARPEQDAPHAAAPPPSTPPSELASLLALGATRVARGQLLAPAGDSAREYLDRAAALAPDAASVAEFRSTVAAAVLEAARAALTQADIERSTELLTAASEIGARAEALDPLVGELTNLREAAQASLDAEQLATVQARLRAGAVLTPPDASAVSLLADLQQRAPATPGLEAAWTDVRSALVADTRAAIGRQDWSAADASLAGLTRVPGASETARTLATELEASRLQQQYLATASPASELGLLRHPTPDYPAQALQRQVEGWVDLEFVVDRAGRTRDVAIVESNPPRLFDDAALTAVRQYEYQPFAREGRVYERRVRLRVRFDLR